MALLFHLECTRIELVTKVCPLRQINSSGSGKIAEHKGIIMNQ